jgi:hypothetical protein
MEELGSTLFPQLNRAAVQEMEVTNALTASFLTGIQNSKVGVSGTMCWTLGTQRWVGGSLSPRNSKLAGKNTAQWNARIMSKQHWVWEKGATKMWSGRISWAICPWGINRSFPGIFQGWEKMNERQRKQSWKAMTKTWHTLGTELCGQWKGRKLMDMVLPRRAVQTKPGCFPLEQLGNAGRWKGIWSKFYNNSLLKFVLSFIKCLVETVWTMDSWPKLWELTGQGGKRMQWVAWVWEESVAPSGLFANSYWSHTNKINANSMSDSCSHFHWGFDVFHLCSQRPYTWCFVSLITGHHVDLALNTSHPLKNRDLCSWSEQTFWMWSGWIEVRKKQMKKCGLVWDDPVFYEENKSRQ